MYIRHSERYYSGELTAPILTICIGGNHEASNHMQELPYGGWLAPNIYYMGYAGVVRFNGIRIMGLSGIYKEYNYLRGHFEFPPYTADTKHSVYHIRKIEEFRLTQLSGDVYICLSHDWPRGIYQHGDEEQLTRFKPFLHEDMVTGKLGSPVAQRLLAHLKPKYWFSAHLHCKFAAAFKHPLVNEDDHDKEQRVTNFLALDKCLPQRRFLQILRIPRRNTGKPHELLDDSEGNITQENNTQLEYDLEWLTILHLTNSLNNPKDTHKNIPDDDGDSDNLKRKKFTPTAAELKFISEKFNNDLRIPNNFVRTSEPFDGNAEDIERLPISEMKVYMNPQTTEFCTKLDIDDPTKLAALNSGETVYEYSTESDVMDNRDMNNTDPMGDDAKSKCKISNDHQSDNKRNLEVEDNIDSTPSGSNSNIALKKPKCEFNAADNQAEESA